MAKIDIYNTSNKYSIIYADPAWSYKDKASAGERGAMYKYSVMSTDDICKLPVEDIAMDDCMLFMWVTMPMFPLAFYVMDKWGFTYKTCAFTWVKQNRKSDTLFAWDQR